MREIFGLLASKMSDEEIVELKIALKKEEENRIQYRIKNNFFEPLTNDECELAKGSRIEAIKKYRERTRCSILEAKEIVNSVVVK